MACGMCPLSLLLQYIRENWDYITADNHWVQLFLKIGWPYEFAQERPRYCVHSSQIDLVAKLHHLTIRGYPLWGIPDIPLLGALEDKTPAWLNTYHQG